MWSWRNSAFFSLTTKTKLPSAFDSMRGICAISALHRPSLYGTARQSLYHRAIPHNHLWLTFLLFSSHVASNVADEVMAQSARRDLKRKHDQLEVGYIKKMMETGGKKARSRFSRLLRDMHPYHDLKVGAPFQPNGESGTGGGTASKKKKSSSKHRKSSSSKYDSSKY